MRRRPVFWARRGVPAWLLWPLSMVFAALAGLRRAAFRHRWCRPVRLPVPVVVVGNLAVGGSGKTPVVAALVACLQAAGHRPAILSRGYGGRLKGAALVDPAGDPADFGDEPVMLARSCGVPVAVGRDRAAAGRLLLARHPGCDVMVCDDGLQHYRLQRDCELVVVDEAVLGNGWRLPAGPLREGLARLAGVDLVVFNGAVSPALRARAQALAPVAHMQLRPAALWNLADPARTATLDDFAGLVVHAYAGIGHPERFFAMLRRHGVEVIAHPFDDHARFRCEDFASAQGQPKLMTAKDAIKCALLGRAIDPVQCWVVPVVVDIEAAGLRLIVEKLERGCKTA